MRGGMKRPTLVFVLLVSAACPSPMSGGTGGGSSAGGGSGGSSGSGGGSSSNTEDLVSGTRLRAVNLVGDDGSKMPLFFWDTMMQTYCSPQFGSFSLLRCYPSGAGGIVSPGGVYADPQCTIPGYVAGN